ncbi:hypothetical protein [Aureispira sp. CCB-QB1]|uniref:hypothetical protein n=1 Tax=Aureispira sp. CCB-QB1 TaxID=1313421 RepID=UPI0006963FB6|nr:hypothetical protein [Aureispira sp. CCB-QB1]
MKEKLKPVLAVILGLSFAFLIIILSQMLGHILYPIPDQFKNIDFSDPANRPQLEALMAMAPTGSLIIVLVGYMLAAFGGGFLAAKIDPTRTTKLGLIVGTLLTLAGISNLMMIPHPIWFVLINLPSYLLFAWLGSRTVNPQ